MHAEVPFSSNVARDELGLVLTGGGARAAYQAGLLAGIAERIPDLPLPILTGVSAGGVNVAHLGAHDGSFREAVDSLVRLWTDLQPERVFHVDARSLGRSVLRWGTSLVSGGAPGMPAVRGLVDTAPLRDFLAEALLASPDGTIPGIAANLRQGRLKAIALTTTSYTTGQTVAWVQGRDIRLWSRPQRISVPADLTIDHVMASAALPIFFPAIKLGDSWHGDGGIRLAAPLSPALHLGATRILAISPRYLRSRAEADEHEINGYPPPAQVLGVMMNAVFLDLIDQDALRLDRLNRVLERLPEEARDGLRIVELLVLRPSRDLGRLARDYEPRLPRTFRHLMRGLGTRETESPDALSMVMFQTDYIQRLIELGRADAEARIEEITAFLQRPALTAAGGTVQGLSPSAAHS